ncbi:uncharacterized protein VP01_578g4 [Puccinia sorghi]|uniref:Nudix hydrolase domain-containing protein n=1 Tax=Puccinia sorghi TaxID=27349 RepID=A0A0L6UIC0_9BASI|nr:uncharacterized protein VP01_578g4 [Puccinia sorghi]
MSRRIFHSLSSVLAGFRLVGLDRLAPLTGVDLANIRSALSSSSRVPKFSSPTPTRHAAVLLGLCNTTEHGPGMILTVRSQNMRMHPGEISFPGGHHDPEVDQSLLGTALREAHEEVGLIPQQIEYLGSLEPLASNSGSTLVWPFVVFVHLLDRPESAFSKARTPMVPRLMSRQAAEPMRSPGLENLHGNHQVAEVELVFQVSLTTLLEPHRQKPSYFRNDPQRPYLEWNLEPEIVSAKNAAAPNHSSQRPPTTTNRLWGLTGWLIKLRG